MEYHFVKAELNLLINYSQKWQVLNLADEVEELFTKHFADEDRRKAMKYLKPQHRKESHSVTFFIGKFLENFAEKGLEAFKILDI